MARMANTAETDQVQRRAKFQQARSRAKKRALVQAAVSLWRANGYAATTVADIAKAVGVSKALFYFYFPRKEDVLFEIGLLSTEAAHRATLDELSKPYEVPAVIEAALRSLERSMRRNPPELITEVILEGYRQEQRILAGDRPGEPSPYIFADLFERAHADGKLPPDVDPWHLAEVAQSLVTEGARHWAYGAYGDRPFAEVVGRDITALVLGVSRP
jgi:AcrR family transcriptional regulator